LSQRPLLSVKPYHNCSGTQASVRPLHIMEVDDSQGPLHFLCTRCNIPRGITRLAPDQANQVCVYCVDGTTGLDPSTELIFCFSQFHEATRDSFGVMFNPNKGMEREEHHCYTCIPQPSIEWDITKSIGLYLRVSDLHQMLRQRVKLLRGDHQHTIDPDFAKAFRGKVHLSEITPGEPDLEFLYELTGALDVWLEEMRSSADGRLSFPASYGSGRLGMDCGHYDASHTIDGKMFSSKMIQQIRLYKKVWMERYNQGENPYAVPVPTPTKELLVQIIRLCPITKEDSSKRNGLIQRHSVYSSDWLVKNLGYRFMTEKSRSNHQAIRLQNFDLTREISQADLG
jgi:hypothetical protein